MANHYERNMATIRGHMAAIKKLFEGIDNPGSLTLMISNPLRPDTELVWSELDLESIARALVRAKERQARQQGAKPAVIIINGT